MAHKIELGVFLPVTNNGWIISKNSPQFLPSFELNRRICEIAAQFGFTYVFSMAKWRGFGGKTDFWKYSIESTILMTGLAASIPKLRMIASVAPALIHPAVFAKMAATMDDVSGGRMGINIVSAANAGEYAQMGLYPENFESFRYDYTEEWLEVVRRLWTEASVTYQGRYFTLDDCQSFPKPVQNTIPIVCATASERGFQFVAEHCSDGFFGSSSFDSERAMNLRMKELAAERGRTIKTHGHMIMIQGENDAEAQQMYDHYAAGADVEAIESVFLKRMKGKGAEESNVRRRERYESEGLRFFYGGIPFVGGPERVADMIEEHYVGSEVDGVMFVFPDFINGLTRFGEQVVPILRKRGLLKEDAEPAPSFA